MAATDGKGHGAQHPYPYAQPVQAPYQPYGGPPQLFQGQLPAQPAQSVPGLRIKLPAVPQQPGQIIVSYEICEAEPGCCMFEDLTTGGLIAIIVLILVFPICAFVPCLMPSCYQRYQRPVYAYPASWRRPSFPIPTPQESGPHTDVPGPTNQYPTTYGEPVPPPPGLEPPRDERLFESFSMYSYSELEEATDNFKHFLGGGSYGRVYKGRLQNGLLVAVKMLIDGGHVWKEFEAEVRIISSVHHRHLVKLLGCCSAANKYILVYEYLPNGSLDDNLHGQLNDPPMAWPLRLKAAIGTAKGLAYLHDGCHPKVIHRDIKSANILLDRANEAMVADFGLARLLDIDQESHLKTRVEGTRGYCDPHYNSYGMATEKLDVYSMGVVILELVTGRRPLEDGNFRLVNWANAHVKSGDYDQLVDPRPRGQYNHEEARRMLILATHCAQLSPVSRPSMSKVVIVLEGQPFAELQAEDMLKGSIYSNIGEGSEGGFDGYDSRSSQTKPDGTQLHTSASSASQLGPNDDNRTKAAPRPTRPALVEDPMDDPSDLL